MKPLLVFLSCLVIAGCAAPGKSTSVNFAPSPQPIDNEIILEEPFDAVWDRLVERLSSSFYVINNIAKDSRLINVSLSADDAGEYCDCGRTNRTSERFGEVEKFSYRVADDSSYRTYQVINGFPVTYEIRRDASVEGRANIYVAPVESGTKVSVNVRYVLTIATSGTYEAENQFGVVSGRGSVDPGHSTIAFGTNDPQKSNLGTPSEPAIITCCSTGLLETRILEMAK